MAAVSSQTRQPRRPATAPGSMNAGFAPSLSASSSTHGSRPLRSSPLAGPVLSRTPSRRSLDGSTRDDNAIGHTRSPGSSTLSFVGTSSPDASSSSFSLVPASKRGKDGPKDKNSSAMSALNFFRRPSSTVGHSSTGHSTASHSSSSATTHSSIFTHSTSSTQLTQCSTPPTDPAFPPPALTHSRAESLRFHPGSRPVSFVDGGDLTSTTPRPTSVAGMSSHVKRPFPVVRSHSSTPTASPSTYRKSTLNPNAHQRSRTSTNADNWNPLWASVTSTVPTNAPKAPVPSKSDGSTNAADKSPFGPAEIPRFSRASLKESGVVMPVSAKDWRRRRSVALPGPPDSPNGLNARSVDKGKGKAREPRVSFVDSNARGPKFFQVPTVQVVPADATQPHVEVKVHPPSPTSDVHPSEPIVTSSTTAVQPEITVTIDTEQQTNPATSATPAHESQPLSPKSSTNTFFSCTSDAPSQTPPSPASLPIPPPSPTASSLFPSSDTSSEEKEKSHPPVRPRPRDRRQSNPQSMSAGSRLSFVDAMTRLSVGSFGSFATAQSGGSEGENSSGVEGDEVRGIDGKERAVLARSRSLDDLASSPLLSPPPLPPTPVQIREHMVVEVAHAISLPPPARFPDHPPRRVTAEWVGGAPRGVTAIPNHTVPSHADGNGDSQASVVSVSVTGGDESRVVGVANEGIIRDEKAKADMQDQGNDREQSIPHMPAQASQTTQQRPQKKGKLTKSRPASISASVHRPDSSTAATTQTTSVEPESGSAPMPTTVAAPVGPSAHGTLKHAPTVLSTIVEDGSSHGHGGSSNGHGQEQERVDANSLPFGKVRKDNAARHTARDSSPVVESILAKAIPSQVGLIPPKGRVPDVKEIAVVTEIDVNASSKASSTPSDVNTPSRSKRFSFLLPVLSFGKLRSKREVRDRDGSASSPNVTLGTYQAGVGPGDVVGVPGKVGKMRKKRGADAPVLSAAPKDANAIVMQSAPDTNTLPNTFANAEGTNITTLPQGSEITLVASSSLYASPSPALPFTTVSPPSLFGSMPGSAASSIRIPATAQSVNPIPSVTEDAFATSTAEVVLRVDEPPGTTANDLCLAHKLSHGHLFKDAVPAVANATATGVEAMGVVDTGHYLRPTSASLAAPRPGTSSSTLTTSSDDASFLTVPLPNPWDGDAVPNPVRLVTPEPQLQAYHHPCPMCGRSSPPKMISQLPVQRHIEPVSTDVDVAPSPAFASQFSAPQVLTPAHLQKSSVPRSLVSPSHFQPSSSPSPCPPPTSPHTPRKLKRPQTSPDNTHKHGSPKKVGRRKGDRNLNASASAVYLPVLPKVERESKVRGVLRGLFGMA